MTKAGNMKTRVVNHDSMKTTNSTVVALSCLAYRAIWRGRAG